MARKSKKRVPDALTTFKTLLRDNASQTSSNSQFEELFSRLYGTSNPTDATTVTSTSAEQLPAAQDWDVAAIPKPRSGRSVGGIRQHNYLHDQNTAPYPTVLLDTADGPIEPPPSDAHEEDPLFGYGHQDNDVSTSLGAALEELRRQPGLGTSPHSLPWEPAGLGDTTLVDDSNIWRNNEDSTTDHGAVDRGTNYGSIDQQGDYKDITDKIESNGIVNSEIDETATTSDNVTGIKSAGMASDTAHDRDNLYDHVHQHGAHYDNTQYSNNAPYYGSAHSAVPYDGIPDGYVPFGQVQNNYELIGYVPNGYAQVNYVSDGHHPNNYPANSYVPDGQVRTDYAGLDSQIQQYGLGHEQALNDQIHEHQVQDNEADENEIHDKDGALPTKATAATPAPIQIPAPVKVIVPMAPHIANNAPPTMYSCRNCGESQTTRESLKTHQKNAHDDPKWDKFSCNWPLDNGEPCGKTIKDSKDYDRHYNIHTFTTEYRCSWPGCSHKSNHREDCKTHSKNLRLHGLQA